MIGPNQIRIKKLVGVPALLTLAVTLLRLTGELLQWSPLFFNKAAGGGGALIGIAWLVPVFGFYFARQLLKADDHPSARGVIGFSLLALAVFAILAGLGLQLPPGSIGIFPTIVIAASAGLFIARRAWPALFSSLFAYGLAARLPIVLIMLVAIMNNWGTHYDVPPPNFPEMAPFAKWVVIGLFPQLTFWMAFTVIIGSLFGGIAVAVTKRRPAAPAIIFPPAASNVS